MKYFYTIGEVSKIFKVSIDTLRYYSKIGLIIPRKIGANGYRHYSIEQFEMISTILFLRSMGIPISKTKEILSGDSLEQLQQVLGEQEKALQNKIHQLQRLKESIISFEEVSKKFLPRHIRVEKLPKMYCVKKAFKTSDVEVDANDVIPFREKLDSSWMDTANIMVTLSSKCILANKFHKYKEYGLISNMEPMTEDDTIEVLEENEYICADAKIYNPDHEDVDQVYRSIITFAKEHALEIYGDAIERNVLDMFRDHEQHNVHFLKIYVPIKRQLYNQEE